MATATNERFVPSGTTGQLSIGAYNIVSGASVTNIIRTDWQGAITLSASSRTNLVPYSDDLTQWGINTGSPTSTTTTMTDTSSSTKDSMYYTVGTIPNDSTTYTIQAVVAKGTGVISLDCEFSGGVSVRYGIYVNLATGGYTLYNVNTTTVGGVGGVIDLGASGWGIWFQNTNNSSGNTTCYLVCLPAIVAPANFTPGVIPIQDAVPTGTITMSKIMVSIGTGWQCFIPTSGAAASVTDYSVTGAGVVTLGQTATGTYTWTGSGALNVGTAYGKGVWNCSTWNSQIWNGIAPGINNTTTGTSAAALTTKITAAGSGTHSTTGTSAAALTTKITAAGTGNHGEAGTSAGVMTTYITASGAATFGFTATSAALLTTKITASGSGTHSTTGTSSASLTTAITGAGSGTHSTSGTSSASLTTKITAAGSGTHSTSGTSSASLTTSITAAGSGTHSTTGTSSASFTTSITATGAGTVVDFTGTSSAILTTYITGAGTGSVSSASITGTSAASLTTSITASGSGTHSTTGTSSASLSILASGSGTTTNYIGTSTGTLAISAAGTGNAGVAGEVIVNVNGSISTFTPGKVTVPDAVTPVQTFGPLGGGGGVRAKEEKPVEKKKQRLITSKLIKVNGSEMGIQAGSVWVDVGAAPIFHKRSPIKGSGMGIAAGSVSVGIEYELQNDDDDLIQILELLEFV